MRKSTISILLITSLALGGCSTLKTAFTGHKEKKAPCKFASLDLTASDLKECGVEIPLNKENMPAGTLARLDRV